MKKKKEALCPAASDKSDKSSTVKWGSFSRRGSSIRAVIAGGAQPVRHASTRSYFTSQWHTHPAAPENGTSALFCYCCDFGHWSASIAQLDSQWGQSSESLRYRRRAAHAVLCHMLLLSIYSSVGQKQTQTHTKWGHPIGWLCSSRSELAVEAQSQVSHSATERLQNKLCVFHSANKCDCVTSGAHR